jgi:hypothetical protein
VVHKYGFLRCPEAWLLAILAILLINGGCGGGGSSNVRPTVSPSNTPGREVEQPGWEVITKSYQQAKKKWTFLVYMNGANDLEEFGSLNLNQMEQIGTNDAINLVVQFKRYAGRYDQSNGNWGDTRRFLVTKDSDGNWVSTPEFSRHPNKDMGDWNSLREFIHWGLEAYPADKYCLVLWNHGAGWRKVSNTAAKTRGFSYDDTTDNHIDTIQIPQAIDLDNLLSIGRKWDIVAFDSSLMQMAEVAHEIRNKAVYIVGSEESPPGEGYPYHLFLRDLANNPDMSPRDFAIKMVERTIEQYGDDSNITHSVLEASKIGEITASMNQLGEALLNVKDTYRDQIIFARNAAENYDYPYYRDILDFARLISQPIPGNTGPPIPDAAVQTAATRVKNAVQSAVIRSVNGNQHPSSTGLSIFLPSPTQYNSLDIDQANGFGQRYGELTFAKDAPNWQSFLINGPR